jgi:hypothetical protein
VVVGATSTTRVSRASRPGTLVPASKESSTRPLHGPISVSHIDALELLAKKVFRAPPDRVDEAVDNDSRKSFASTGLYDRSPCQMLVGMRILWLSTLAGHRLCTRIYRQCTGYPQARRCPGIGRYLSCR